MAKAEKYLTFLTGLCLLALMQSCGIQGSLNHAPETTGYNTNIPERVKLNDTTFIAGNNFLLKNKYGLWELYAEGDPLERGLVTGRLTEELYKKQETVFMEKISTLVPSPGQRNFLRKFLNWYNRKMYRFIAEEYKSEIYGVSRYASDDFNSLAPPYLRALYLHAAHDIGHALQDLVLVGCTSFAVWGDKSKDGNLLIGRNFDFYAGDAFAEEKIVAFVNPDQGYKFMSVTWGGMIGVVSGMNEKGLTVTINAGKSRIPLVAKTPISIVTREILQYASTIDEAIAIAEKKEVFVSEAIMVGSKADGKAVLIEMSPNNFGVFEVQNSSELICSNHFQSEAYENDKRNKMTQLESHSVYRFRRMEQLLEEQDRVDPSKAVNILRNRMGLDDVAIGHGNEKALNQLLAHHGIVFQPESLRVWVSANPYQLGAFVGYDLKEVFGERENNPATTTLALKNRTIPADPFLKTEAYAAYERYRELETRAELFLQGREAMAEQDAEALIENNPEYWKAYYLAGRYYYEMENFHLAERKFRRAAALEIASVPEREEVEKYLRKSERKAK